MSTRLISNIAYHSQSDAQRLDLLLPDPLPEQPAPAILQIHGGGWYTGGRSAEANQLFADCGFVTASMDYRLSQEAIFPAQIHDVKMAIQWLRAHSAEYHLDPDRIGIWGSSAGGHLVALAGTTGDLPALNPDQGAPGFSNRVQAVIDICGPTDFFETDGEPFEALLDAETRLLGGAPADLRDLADLANPITHIASAGRLPAFVIMHCEDDDIVPFVQSVIFEEALQKAGADVRLIGFPKGGHGLEGHGDEMLQTALTFFSRILGPV